MDWNIFFFYFGSIHFTIVFYYILQLFLNQLRYRFISLKKTDGITAIEVLRKKYNIYFPVEILSRTFAETSSYKLYNNKLVINSEYAALSFLDNISFITLNYLAGSNQWIRNNIFVSNYLTLSYYTTILFVIIYFIIGGNITILLTLTALSVFTALLILDFIIRTIHSDITLNYLINAELIDREYEVKNIKKVLIQWNITNFKIYFRIFSDIREFIRIKKTSP